MELFKESFCPLFLTYALVLLLICIKAAFFTHGMSKWDLLFGVVVLTIAGGYFAQNTDGLIMNTVFNVVAPAVLLRYLGAEFKPLVIIISLFLLCTLIAYYVKLCF